MRDVRKPPAAPDAAAERRDKPDRGSEGSALVMAVFVLVLLAGVGVALLFLSQTEVKMSKSDSQSKKVFFLAEAGLEAGRADLVNNNNLPGGIFLDGKLESVAGENEVLDFTAESVRPVYGNDGVIIGFDGIGDDTPLVALTPFGDGHYAAFLTNDAAHGESESDPDDDNNRVMVTGIGAAADGSIEIVQAIIEPEFIFPDPPALITLLGPTPDFYGGTNDCPNDDWQEVENYFGAGDDDDDDDDAVVYGAPDAGDDDDDDDVAEDVFSDGDDPLSKSFAGTDCNVSGLWVPVVATINDAAEATAEHGIDPGNDNFDKGDGVPSGDGDDDDDDDDATPATCNLRNEYYSGTYSDTDTFANGYDDTEPTVITGHGPMSEVWTNCQAMVDTIEKIREAASYECTMAPCTLPATTQHSVLFIDDDLQLNDADDGMGLLLVTGRLSMDANTSWNGLIVVVGEGEFIRTGGSGGVGTITGATIVANLAGADRIYGTNDDCTGGVNGFDVAVYHEADNMIGDTEYCLDSVEDAMPLHTMDVKGFRQR